MNLGSWISAMIAQLYSVCVSVSVVLMLRDADLESRLELTFSVALNELVCTYTDQD
jgi:hypothetical protein